MESIYKPESDEMLQMGVKSIMQTVNNGRIYKIQKLSSMKGVRKISNFLVVPEIYFSPGDYYRTVFP